MLRRLPPRSRAVLLSAAVVLPPAAASLVCVGLGAHALTAAVATPDPAGALLGLAALALAGVLAWAAAAAAAGIVEAWSGSSSRPARPPRAPVAASGAARRTRTGVVSAGVAALVVSALTAPAASAASGPGAAVPTVVVSQQVDTDRVEPRPPPTLATEQAEQAERSTPATAPGSWAALAEAGFRAPRGASVGTASLVTAQPTRQIAPEDAGVVVVAGDSLWSIAARHLGPGADDAEVAAAWPRWWQANRHIVGEDPDLLRPGQRLVVPAP